MTLHTFIHDLRWDDLPTEIQHQARRCLLDTVGVAVSGRGTELSRIVHEFVAAAYPGKGAQLWLDRRVVSPPGAALANGMTIDAVDMHDGHPLTKGHAGAAIVPAIFATMGMGSRDMSGKALLTMLVIGYEVAFRAGISLHETTCDYHTSGAWNALGCAALVARRGGLTEMQTRHALGIAEYHGPRSQMMRCIDHPTMLKDGSGWGAMAGVSAALMAQAGFTGAPALTVEEERVAYLWADLGDRWRITEQYFKPHAVCRWAQPAIERALELKQAHDLDPQEISRIEVHTFHEAVRLDHPRPETTELAQYSLPFPLAAAVVHGQLGAAEISGDNLTHPEVLRLAEAVTLIEDETFNDRFPARRFARVRIELRDGQTVESEAGEAQWDADSPPSDEALLQKFRWLSRTQLPEWRANSLEAALWQLDNFASVRDVTPLLMMPSDHKP